MALLSTWAFPPSFKKNVSASGKKEQFSRQPLEEKLPARSTRSPSLHIWHEADRIWRPRKMMRPAGPGGRVVILLS